MVFRAEGESAGIAADRGGDAPSYGRPCYAAVEIVARSAASQQNRVSARIAFSLRHCKAPSAKLGQVEGGFPGLAVGAGDDQRGGLINGHVAGIKGEPDEPAGDAVGASAAAVFIVDPGVQSIGVETNVA